MPVSKTIFCGNKNTLYKIKSIVSAIKKLFRIAEKVKPETETMVHLVNLTGFGGVERMLSDCFLDTQPHNHYIINTASRLTEKLTHQRANIIQGMPTMGYLKIRPPTLIRKYLLWRKINALNPACIVIWNQVINPGRKNPASKVIYYDHGAAWELPNNEKVRRFFQQINGCICVSEAAAKMLRHRFNPKGNISVLLNRIRLPTRITVKPAASEGGIIVGCAARLTALKAPGLIPLIVEEVLKRGFAIKFILAGEGELREALQRLIDKKQLGEQIELRGFINNMAEFYQSLDIYISTSAHETCSLSCMEALAHAVPVIAANIDGQPEIIQNGVSGFCLPPCYSIAEYCQATGLASPFNHSVYYPASDSIGEPLLLHPAQAADKLIEIYRQPDHFYRQNARARAEKQFSAKNFSQQLIERIQQMANDPQSDQ